MHTRSARRLPLAALAAGLVLPFLLAPAASADPGNLQASEHGNYRGQCRKLTKQITHYEETVLPMAIQRGNRSWEQATNAQIERLWHRRADLCPEYGAERTLMRKAADQARKVNKVLSAAGRAAAAYFTGGVGGF